MAQPQSLFSMIRHTEKQNPQHTVIAYADNASVMEGTTIERFVARSDSQNYQKDSALSHVLMNCLLYTSPSPRD